MPRHCKIEHCHHPRRMLRSPHTAEKHESKFCKYHACHSTDSYYEGQFVLCENVARQGSRYCAYHPKCRVPGCRARRLFEDDTLGRFYCDLHTCRVSNCAIPASGHDKHCEMHKVCGHGGCNKFRIKSPDGRGWLNVCADHVIRRCYSQGCRNEAMRGSVLCEFHKCLMATCGGPKQAGGNFCAAHTCGIEGCNLLISHPQKIIHGRPRGCFYCDFHECGSSGCHAQATIHGGHCNSHGCTVRGCRKPRSSESNAGAYCIDHYTESVRRSAEAIGRDKEQAAFQERQRKAREEAREKEREARIQRQRQEELDHLKAERDAAQEARERAEREAKRLADESERRRYIAEMERQLLERERENNHRKRRSFEATSTAGSTSMADHPISPTWNDKFPPSPTVDDHEEYYSSGDESWDAGYLHPEYRTSGRTIPGVRHLHVRYGSA